MKNNPVKETLSPPYESRRVANHLIDIAYKHEESISIMRLLKLAYMAHGWTLAVCDEPLVNEDVEAWRYGPVIPLIYYAFRPHGAYNLKKVKILNEQPIIENVSDLMEDVYRVYKNVSDSQLYRLTHSPGGPWHKVYEPNKLGIVIPNKLISDHFKNKLERARNE